jgi:hypothetical protein
MRGKRRLFLTVTVACAASIGFIQPVSAYTDPATTSSVLVPLLAPVVAILLGVIAFFVRPVRRFFGSIARRLLVSLREEPSEAADEAKDYFQLDDTDRED